MPPLDEPAKEKSLLDVVEEVGAYPLEAYDFLQRGLSFTVHKIHGENPDPETSHHVSGQQLCGGLREYALMQWGLLARAVFRRWNITSTFDFGKMVFALVDNGLMQKTDEDNIDDFRNVFDFKTLETDYRIESKL